MKLSEQDIKKIKYEKRPGIVFSSGILVAGAFFNLLYFTVFKSKIDLAWVIFIDFGVILISFLISSYLNRNFNKDLGSGIKKLTVEKVLKKEYQTEYEAGSGRLHIGHEMRTIQKLNLIINNCRYEVNENFFNQINEGDFVEMYYSQHSNILLNIEKKISE